MFCRPVVLSENRTTTKGKTLNVFRRRASPSPYLAWQFSTWQSLCSSLSLSVCRTGVIPRWRGSPPPAAVPPQLIFHFCKPPGPRRRGRCRRTLHSRLRRAAGPSGLHQDLWTGSTRWPWRSSGSSSTPVWTWWTSKGGEGEEQSRQRVLSHTVELYPSEAQETLYLSHRNMRVSYSYCPQPAGRVKSSHSSLL